MSFIRELKYCPKCHRPYTTDFCGFCCPPSYCQLCNKQIPFTQNGYCQTCAAHQAKEQSLTSAYNQQINSLSQELGRKDKLIQEAQEDNKKQRQVIERLEKENDAYSKKINSLNQDIQKMDRQIREAQQDKKKLEKENDTYSKQIKSLNQDIQKINRLERENATYVNQINSLNQEIQKKNKQIQDPQEENKRQRQIIEKLENENAAYATQINSLNQKIVKMEKQLNEAQQGINSELDILKKENFKLKQQLKDSQSANIPEGETLLSFASIFEKLDEDVSNVVKSNNLDPMGIRKAIEKEYHSKVKEHLLLLTNLCDKSMVTYKNILQELEATEQKLIENLINIPGMLTDEQRGRLSPLKGEKEKQELAYKKWSELKEAITKLIK